MNSKKEMTSTNSDVDRCPSDLNMTAEENMICNILEGLGRSPCKLNRLDLSNVSYLEDMEPPSFYGSSYDSCLLSSSTPNSTRDKMALEQLVSLSSTDDKFTRYSITDSVMEDTAVFDQQLEQVLTDKQVIGYDKYSGKSKDTADDTVSSIAKNTDDTNNDGESGNKTKSTDFSSYNFELEALNIMERLKQTEISAVTSEENQSFLGLDKISDSILVDSTSRDESFAIHTDIEETPIKKSAKTGESFIVSRENVIKNPIVNTTFDKEPPKEHNATVVIESNIAPENLCTVPIAQLQKSPLNTTFEKLPSRMQKVNRTFDKCSDIKVVEGDKAKLANETVVLSCANKTMELTDVSQNGKKVEDLNNGVFLMGGEETNLMDMQACDLISVLSQSTSSKSTSKRHSLHNKEKGTPSSKNVRRISLSMKESLLKDGIKLNENKLKKKLDVNPFSGINLFKGKMRGTVLKNDTVKKGPMKATYVPEQNRFEESPLAEHKTRAVSSPCTGSKVGTSSKSEENSRPPLPSFGSVSTIDSDPLSTSEFGTSNTPEVFRRKNTNGMITSTPSMNYDGPYGKVSMLRMNDFPTPIAAPTTKTPLRNETLTNQGSDKSETTSTRDSKSDKSGDDKTKVQEEAKSSENEATLVKADDNNSIKILNNTKQKQPTPAKYADRTRTLVKVEKVADKENVMPIKTKSTTAGQPLREKPIKATARPAPTKPLTNKPTINNRLSKVGRLIAKPIEKKSAPRTEPLPRRSLLVPVKSNIQPSQKKPLPSKPLPIVQCAKVQVEVPKVSVKTSVHNTSKSKLPSDVKKKQSSIPRPTFKSRLS